MQTQPTYNYSVVRQFAVMTVVWGIVGMLVGVVIAAQLIWPELNVAPWFSYGRLRPLHTNAVIFAFGGCALFATSYYVVQRTCQTRLFGDRLAAFTFWGWQAVIVAAAVTLPLGISSAKEYAELEWPIDVLIALVWIAYAIVFFGTIAKRKTPHIYVANWFFGGFILTVALLHIVNSAAIPVTLWKSYSAYAGVQDAMVQWWYGHNAVGFFLTAGFLGMMYYFIPKQANRPVYSYRLSVVHFWALIFTYMNTHEQARRFVITARGPETLTVSTREAVEVRAASTEAVAVALRVDPAVVRPGAYDVVFHIEAVDEPGVSTNEKSRFFVR